jgi:hypothetical protein
VIALEQTANDGQDDDGEDADHDAKEKEIIMSRPIESGSRGKWWYVSEEDLMEDQVE